MLRRDFRIGKKNASRKFRGKGLHVTGNLERARETSQKERLERNEWESSIRLNVVPGVLPKLAVPVGISQDMLSCAWN